MAREYPGNGLAIRAFVWLLIPDSAVKRAGRVSEPFGKLTTAWSSEDTQLCSFKVVFAFSHPVVVSLGRAH